jgi:hypothetical protein
MVRGKILLVIVLYIALGVIAFFNFGLCGYLLEKFERKPTVTETRWKKIGENIKKIRSGPQEEVQDTPLAQDTLLGQDSDD